MKQAVLNLLRVTGAFAPFRLANRRRLLILTYHRFCATDDGLNTSARALAEQLEYLLAHYTVWPLARIAEAQAAGARLPPAPAAITIDDGYRDAWQIALPILRRYQVPATLYVVTGFVDRNAWVWTDKARFLTSRAPAKKIAVTLGRQALHFELSDKEARRAAAARLNAILKRLPEAEKERELERLAALLEVNLPHLPPEEFSPITWDQAREMDAAGIEIGSHTVTHPILTGVSDERLQSELQQSRARLETILGRSVTQFCYPNGACDARVREAAAQAGYRSAVTTEFGFNRSDCDPLALSRIHTEPDMAHFVQSTSGLAEVRKNLRRLRSGTTQGSVFEYHPA
jgi:peptidoglycan/xylan/chitin deacetylase (PgdA/CDA1 family)